MEAKKIEVVAVRPIDKGNLRAFVSVRLGGVTIHDCRVIQQQGQAAWVSMPQREYTDKQGQKKYSAIVELSEALKKSVSALVLQSWEQGSSGRAGDEGF